MTVMFSLVGQNWCQGLDIKNLCWFVRGCVFGYGMQASVWQLLGRISMCIVLLALVFLGTTNSQADWVLKVQELGGGRIAWLGCFLVMLVTQLAWKPFRNVWKCQAYREVFITWMRLSSDGATRVVARLLHAC